MATAGDSHHVGNFEALSLRAWTALPPHDPPETSSEARRGKKFMLRFASDQGVHVKLTKIDLGTREFKMLACGLPGSLCTYSDALDGLRAQGWEFHELDVAADSDVFSSSCIIKSSAEVSSGLRLDGAPVSSGAEPFWGAQDVDDASVHSAASALAIDILEQQLQRSELRAAEAQRRADRDIALALAQVDCEASRAAAADSRAAAADFRAAATASHADLEAARAAAALGRERARAAAALARAEAAEALVATLSSRLADMNFNL